MSQKEFSIFASSPQCLQQSNGPENVHLCLLKSHISYSISLWRATEVILNKMIVRQKKIRALLKLPHQTHCTEHVQRLEILMVPSLYNKPLWAHNHNTRHKHLFSERNNLKLVESKPKYSRLQKLPISFRNIQSVDKWRANKNKWLSPFSITLQESVFKI